MMTLSDQLSDSDLESSGKELEKPMAMAGIGGGKSPAETWADNLKCQAVHAPPPRIRVVH